jgi:acetyl-CoA carboxylase biotin carboxylase subunit
MAFSDTEFFLEKYLPEARHIEIQILADGEKFLHLGERECSIQRRFQKILEESPSPFLDEKTREKIANCAIKLAKELKYNNIGTFEFLVDENKNFYLMEVNPRLQVEHPITEARTKIDLVEQQIRICQGEKIKFSQDDISFEGWAIEARICAEDPSQNFKPSTGKVERYLPPGGQGIFVHTFLHEGQEILPYFDSLLMKIIAFGKDRKEAISRLKRAIGETIIEGVKTNIPFFKVLLEDEDFLAGIFNTEFIERKRLLEKIKEVPVPKPISIEKKEISEKEIAEIVFKIYQALKGEKIEKEEISKWQIAERLKLFE